MIAELVGRDRELGMVLGFLDRAVAGAANLVVCVGEPGIGKTRLAEEVRRAAEQRGVQVSWGRVAADRGAPPYWPWREVLAGLPAAEPGDSADLSAGHREPSFEERMARFDGVRRRLGSATRHGPLLVVIDDLDAADEPSQLLALYLARSLRTEPVLLLLTCRATSGTMGLLASEPSVAQFELHGLPQAAAARQIAAILGRDPSDDEVRTLQRATSGNPFFLAELARQLADGTGLLSDQVPRSVRHAVEHRVGQLTPQCRETLQAAAVIGPSFTLPVLSAVIGRPVADSLRLLDHAARATLVGPDGAPGRFRFTHELVRDAIVAGLDPSRRMALHRGAAEALEQLSGAPTDTTLFDLARHWSQAAAVDGDTLRAVTWIQRAGHEAMRRHAYEDGRRWFATALALGDTRLDDLAHAELLLALASAAALASDLAGALRTCQHVVDIAYRSGIPELAARAALVPQPTFDHDVDTAIRALCEQALALVQPTSAASRAKVLAQYAIVCDHLADLSAAQPAVDESIALADASGDLAAVEAALIAHHMVRSGPDGLDEREANAERMRELGTRKQSAEAHLMAAEWRFDAASERGDLAGAARELEVIGRWALTLGGPISRWRALRCRAMLAQARGRLADAHRQATEAFQTMAATGFPPAYLLYSGHSGVLAHHTGYRPGIRAILGMTEEDATLIDFPLEGVIATLAPAAGLFEVGRVREARVIYRRLGPATEWQESPHAQLFTWAYGILTAVGLSADEDVVVLRDRLGKFRGRHIVNGRYAMAYFGPAELWLGIGAAHLGLVHEAIEDLQQAVKACTANGAEGFRAEAQYHLARVLFQRSAPDDVVRARGIALDALRCAEELGMPPLHEAGTALLARIDADPAVGLTRREREVAVLVAEGLTNRAIADRLVLSERTAQNHVQHILDKLQLPNRSQVAVWARENLRAE